MTNAAPLNMNQLLGDQPTDLNPEPRCPCVLLLDTSESMQGKSIQELQAGLQTLQEELSKDRLASLRIEVAVVTFGGAVVVAQDFIHPDDLTPPTLRAEGDTPMAAAIHKAFDLIDKRRSEYQKQDLDSYTPWIFMLTDGEPTDWDEAGEAAAERIRLAESKSPEGRVAFFAIGVENANMAKLSEISRRRPLKLKSLRFSSMFRWISRSLIQVSRSRIGDSVKLFDPMRDGWAEV